MKLEISRGCEASGIRQGIACARLSDSIVGTKIKQAKRKQGALSQFREPGVGWRENEMLGKNLTVL